MERVDEFVQWMNDNNFNVSPKLKIRHIDERSNLGVIATERIDLGEVLFQIPCQCVLSHTTTRIASLLEKNWPTVQTESGWVPLLLSLMHETSTPDSFWAPYLRCVPNFCGLDLPMFWDPNERDSLLKGTGIPEVVCRDNKMIEKDFDEIVLPFVTKHSEYFSSECRKLGYYKQLVAFVMAYSFHDLDGDNSDDEEEDDDEDHDKPAERKEPIPYMIPMADMLNHIDQPHAKLIIEEPRHHMEAIRVIEAGEEVFNFYGDLSNDQLLLRYGFSLPPERNHFNVVELPVKLLDDYRDRWDRLVSANVFEDGFIVPVDHDGIMNVCEVLRVLNCLSMSDGEFEAWLREHQSTEDGWEEEDDDDHLDQLSQLHTLSALPLTWRTILDRLCSARLELLHQAGPAGDTDRTCSLGARNRALFAAWVVTSQVSLLDMLRSHLRVAGA